MNKTRKFVALTTAATLAISLAACSSGGGDQSSSSGDSKASGGNTLTVWTWDPAFNILAMQEAEKIYQKDHPDFKLNIIETPWDDLQTKVTTLANSGQLDSMPDIFLMQNNAFQKNVINYPDLFSDLGQSKIDFAEFPEGVTGYSVIDGVNYGLPFDAGTAISAFRTDILEKAGYTVKDFTDITWDEYITKGKDVLAKTGVPLMTTQAGAPDLLMMILQSAGASLFDAEGNPTIAGNADLIKALDIYAQLVKAGVLVEYNSWDEYIGSLVNGKVAGALNGVWIIASLKTAEDQSGKWEVTNLPKLAGVASATNYSANGGSSWAISGSSKNYDLAADFLASTFAGSTDLYDTLLPAAGVVANWIPAGESPVYTEPQEFFGGQPVFKLVSEFGPKVPKNNTGAYYYEGRDAMGKAISQIISGTDPTKALAEAQSDVEFAMK